MSNRKVSKYPQFPPMKKSIKDVRWEEKIKEILAGKTSNSQGSRVSSRRKLPKIRQPEILTKIYKQSFFIIHDSPLLYPCKILGILSNTTPHSQNKSSGQAVRHSEQKLWRRWLGQADKAWLDLRWLTGRAELEKWSERQWLWSFVDQCWIGINWKCRLPQIPWKERELGNTCTKLLNSMCQSVIKKKNQYVARNLRNTSNGRKHRIYKTQNSMPKQESI